MNYQVLARKWRPQDFNTVVGQEHVTRALINSLTQNRLHHAYLFTGTRGVGKTTLARILAKCLNCDQGVTATPCGTCQNCQAIEKGQFIDLIEVDAASRTKVEDTRTLLDNVQYTPNYGRYKIYLIDEVHMLSGHSFNALLKTLEEPPPHVKFLLATTDPQKIPITVLSRCLQFNLKTISIEKTASHLAEVLNAEKIAYDASALKRLARASGGSVRDALSLLDQAISFSNNNVTLETINSMLSTIEDTQLYNLIKSLANKELQEILEVVSLLSEQSVDFSNALEEILSILHHLALIKAEPTIQQEDWGDTKTLHELSNLFTSEEIQLYYQIALVGRRDLPLAPTPKIGFEMVLLRMLAFHKGTNPTKSITPPATSIQIQPQKTSKEWQDILPQLKLTGATKALATHCALSKIDDASAELLLHSKHAPMLHNRHAVRLSEAFSTYFSKPMRVNIKIVKETINTPDTINNQVKSEQQKKAKEIITNDKNIQALKDKFNATIIPSSINSETK